MRCESERWEYERMNATISQIIQQWPQEPRESAQRLVEYYGEPEEFTPSMLIWYNREPWKKTILSKDPIKHNFPSPHNDYFEQVIDFRVPVDKFDDLAAYDGSIMAERTKGELS